MGCLGRGVGSGRAAGVASVKTPGAAPHPIQPVPASLQWPHYRQNIEEKAKNTRWREEEGEKSERQQQESSRWEEGRRHSRHWSRYFPAARGEDHSGVDSHTMAHGGPPTRAGGCFLKELQPVESPHWSRLKVWGRRSCREELIYNDHSPHPHCTTWGWVEKPGVKLSLGERGGKVLV